MIIQNANRCYEVVRQLKSADNMAQFLCQEQQLQKPYLLVRIDDGVLAKRFTLFLEEKIKANGFADYIECFQQTGTFYAVFPYSLEQSLTDKLSGEICGRKERAEIARKLLERMLLRDPHPYFMKNALKPELITVSPGMDVTWNYDLGNVGEFDPCTMEMVFSRLAGVMELLFNEELDKRLYPLLDDFVHALTERKMQTYLDLYREFMPVFGALLQEDQDERLPQTWLFRAWERCKKLLGLLRKVLMVALLMAAVVYVIYTFRNMSGSESVQQTIKQIGDIMIE